jgi:hypothetical protein
VGIVVGLSAFAADAVYYSGLHSLETGLQLHKKVQIRSEIASDVVLIIAGLMLLLRGKGIVRVVNRIRDAE